MNIYEVEFMEYTNGMRDTVWNKKIDKYISVNRKGFVAKESDLDYLKEFGGGFKTLRFVGELYQGNIDSLVINVSCNLVGEEDIERTIKELENQLKNMKVELTI